MFIAFIYLLVKSTVTFFLLTLEQADSLCYPQLSWNFDAFYLEIKNLMIFAS